MMILNRNNSSIERTCIISKEKNNITNLIKITHNRKDNFIYINNKYVKGRSVYISKQLLNKIDKSKLIKLIFGKLKLSPNNEQTSIIEKFLTD